MLGCWRFTLTPFPLVRTRSVQLPSGDADAVCFPCGRPTRSGADFIAVSSLQVIRSDPSFNTKSQYFGTGSAFNHVLQSMPDCHRPEYRHSWIFGPRGTDFIVQSRCSPSNRPQMSSGLNVIKSFTHFLSLSAITRNCSLSPLGACRHMSKLS